MKAELKTDIFNTCLARIQRGEDLLRVLADYPHQREELEPLLAVAKELRLAAQDIPAPSLPAQSRSKALFLKAAQQPADSAPGWLTWFRRLNFATLVGVILLMVIVGGVGVNIAAAQALPGDALYPVKLAQEQARLSLAMDDSTRLRLEEEFNHERLAEIEKLEQSNKRAEVKFEGILEFRDGNWWASGILLDLPAEWQNSSLLAPGRYVEVRGVTVGGGVLVTELRQEDADDEVHGGMDSTSQPSDDLDDDQEQETKETPETQDSQDSSSSDNSGEDSGTKEDTSNSGKGSDDSSQDDN